MIIASRFTLLASALLLASGCGSSSSSGPSTSSGAASSSSGLSGSGGSTSSSGGGSSSGSAVGDGGSRTFDASTPAGICTETTGDAVAIKIKNERSEPILVLWLRPGARPGTSCDEVDYGVIGANTEREQKTYVGHAWAIRSEVTGALLKATTVGGSETVVVR